MTITTDTIKTRFPEFEETSPARVALFIADAYAVLDPTLWGDRIDLGACYYVAHELTLSNKNKNVPGGAAGTTGAVTSKSVDGVGISFSAPNYSVYAAYFSQTAYGQKYLSLKQSLGIQACVV